ncbi:MAG: hypothetical protein WCQ96_00730 [Patescibacteria group bacterium]
MNAENKIPIGSSIVLLVIGAIAALINEITLDDVTPAITVVAFIGCCCQLTKFATFGRASKTEKVIAGGLGCCAIVAIYEIVTILNIEILSESLMKHIGIIFIFLNVSSILFNLSKMIEGTSQ